MRYTEKQLREFEATGKMKGPDGYYIHVTQKMVKNSLIELRSRERITRLLEARDKARLEGIKCFQDEDGNYRCAVCLRKLTHKVSIAMGEGPVCGNHDYSLKNLR